MGVNNMAYIIDDADKVLHLSTNYKHEDREIKEVVQIP